MNIQQFVKENPLFSRDNGLDKVVELLVLVASLSDVGELFDGHDELNEDTHEENAQLMSSALDRINELVLQTLGQANPPAPKGGQTVPMYTPETMPKRGKARKLFNALSKRGIEVKAIHYVPPAWGAADCDSWLLEIKEGNGILRSGDYAIDFSRNQIKLIRPAWCGFENDFLITTGKIDRWQKVTPRTGVLIDL